MPQAPAPRVWKILFKRIDHSSCRLAQRPGMGVLLGGQLVCPIPSSETVRIAAANSILDRGYGKPKVDQIDEAELPPIVIQRAE